MMHAVPEPDGFEETLRLGFRLADASLARRR
jgi:hypothetical protein